MKKNINLIVFVLISVLFAWLIFYGINSNLVIKKMELENSVKLRCGQTYRYTETLPSGAVTSYPMEKEFQECLQSN